MTLLELKLETAIKEATHGEVRLLQEDAEAILELLREQDCDSCPSGNRWGRNND